MDWLNRIFEQINNVLIIILTVCFAPQLFYVFLFFFKIKKYPEAKVKHRFAAVIPARNEATVIKDIIASLRAQNYPSELLDIYIIADNCTDGTAALAREAGAYVVERFDDARRNKGYALNYGLPLILAENPEIECFVFFDADNLLHPDCIARFNDAFDGGARLAQAKSASKNLTQNTVTAVSGLYYLRDNRFTCHARAVLHTDQNLSGTGMLVCADIIKAKGWNAVSLSEDAEFNFNMLLAGEKTRYVPEARYYEEQPATLKDTFRRNIRMGCGLNKLFYTRGIPMLCKFFYTFRYAYLDMFLSLLFIPMAVFCCLWFPFYYIYMTVFAALNYAADPEALHFILKMIAIALTLIFYLPFLLQTFLAIYLERKELKNCDKGVLIRGALVFPFYMIIYMVGITIGAFTIHAKWRAITRSGIPQAAEPEREPDLNGIPGGGGHSVQPVEPEERKESEEISPKNPD